MTTPKLLPTPINDHTARLHPTAPPLDLDALAALDAARTPGEWHWWTSNSLCRLSSSATNKDGDVVHAYVAHDGVPDISISRVNMKAIEGAVNALGPLLARVRAAEARVAELEERMAEARASGGAGVPLSEW